MAPRETQILSPADGTKTQNKGFYIFPKFTRLLGMSANAEHALLGGKAASPASPVRSLRRPGNGCPPFGGQLTGLIFPGVATPGKTFFNNDVWILPPAGGTPAGDGRIRYLPARHRTCLYSVKTKKFFLVPKSQENFFASRPRWGRVLTLHKRPVCVVDTQLASELCFTTSLFWRPGAGLEKGAKS